MSGVEDDFFYFIFFIPLRITAYNSQLKKHFHHLCLGGIFLSMVAMETYPLLLRECAAGFGISDSSVYYVLH